MTMHNSSAQNSKVDKVAYSILDSLRDTGRNQRDLSSLLKVIGILSVFAEHNTLDEVNSENFIFEFIRRYPTLAESLNWDCEEDVWKYAPMDAFDSLFQVVIRATAGLSAEEFKNVFNRIYEIFTDGDSLGRWEHVSFPTELLQFLVNTSGRKQDEYLGLNLDQFYLSLESLRYLSEHDSVYLTSAQESISTLIKLLAVLNKLKAEFVDVFEDDEDDDEAECVVIHLCPFGRQMRGAEPIGEIVPKFVHEEYLAKFIHNSSTNGRLLILVTDSALSGSSRAARDVRQLLIEHGALEQVVALPSAIFPHTQISSNVLVLDKRLAHNEVQFVDLSKCRNAHTRRLNLFDIDAAANVLAGSSKKNLFSVSKDRISEEAYSLQLSWYRPNVAPADSVPLEAVLTRVARFKPDFNKVYRRVAIKDFNAQDTLKAQSFEECEVIHDDENDYLGHKFFSEPVILVSKIVNQKITLAYFEPCNGEAIAIKGDVMAFSVNKNVLALWLVQELLSDDLSERIRDLSVGAAMRRITPEAFLKKVLIEIPPLQAQQEEELRKAKQAILQEHFDESEIRELYRSESLKLKKHLLSQYVAGLLNTVGPLTTLVKLSENIPTTSPLIPGKEWTLVNRLEAMKEQAKQMGVILENLLNPELLDPLDDYQLIKLLPSLASSLGSVNQIEVAFDINWKSFEQANGSVFNLFYMENASLDDLEGASDYDPIIRISERNLRDILQNFVANAKVKGASKVMIKLSIIDDPTADTSDRLYTQLEVSNNGKAFDSGFTLERFFTKGDSLSESTGLGGYHVKRVLDHTRGLLTNERRDCELFPVCFNLQFPISEFTPIK